jgi:CheY-like chemotaxis protein
MPDVSGGEIARTIRSDERLKETKIILMTSMLRYVTAQDEQFANKVLLKPMNKDDLEAAVIEMLRRPDHQTK